jgi:hypothetical protein
MRHLLQDFKAPSLSAVDVRPQLLPPAELNKSSASQKPKDGDLSSSEEEIQRIVSLMRLCVTVTESPEYQRLLSVVGSNLKDFAIQTGKAATSGWNCKLTGGVSFRPDSQDSLKISFCLDCLLVLHCPVLVRQCPGFLNKHHLYSILQLEKELVKVETEVAQSQVMIVVFLL